MACVCVWARAMQCNATLLSKRREGALLLRSTVSPFPFFYFCLILIFTAQSNKELVPACLFSAACTRIQLTSILKFLPSTSQLP